MFEFYPRYEEWFARAQLICFMLGMGVHLAISDFWSIARQPRSFLFGFVAQVIVVPLWAFASCRLFAVEPAIAVGIILVASMPGGTLSKVLTYLGRGNAPLSIALTGVSTLAALVTVPVTLRLLAAGYVPDDFAMPLGVIIADVAIFLLLPLALGMLLGRIYPQTKVAIGRWSVRLGFMVVAAMILGAIGSERIRPTDHGWRVWLAIILFCVVGAQLAMLPFYALPLPRPDRMAVGAETTIRNVNLALLLHASLFAGNETLSGGVLFAILFYAAAALVAGLPLALNHRRLARRESVASASYAVSPPTK